MAPALGGRHAAAAAGAGLLLALAACGMPRSNAWQIWTEEKDGPGPRAGHTLLLFNDTLYLWGGRGNEVRVEHDPKTYSVARINGTLTFTGYHDKHVKQCFGPDGALLDSDALSAADYQACYNITIGTYYNDLWSYPLNCTRAGTSGCLDEGWKMVAPGAHMGGCINYKETLQCTHPQERFDHAAAVLWERQPTSWRQRMRDIPNVSIPAHLIVYGGQAQLCEDFCSDMWEFPLTDCLSNATRCRWRQMGTLGNEGPGRRRRAASAHDETRWVLYGGHRLWQGFAPENSLANRWAETSTYPFGGFLDDLWVFTWNRGGVDAAIYNASGVNTMRNGYRRGTKDGAAVTQPWNRELSLGMPVPIDQGAWQQVIPREQCHKDPGTDWDRRNDIACTLVWPPPRAQAAIVLTGEFLYLHGGYSVAGYPYPHVLARGAGPGTSALRADGSTPYPAQPTLFNDMWLFNWLTGLWVQLAPVALGGVFPAPRRGHSLVLAGEALLLTSGYTSNAFLNDLWIYNTTTDRWLRKTYHAYPQYPDNCTADVTLEPASGLETPIRDVWSAADGIFLARTSVAGEPTRGRLTDGQWGRADAPVFIPQARRRAPGWDGCRDRADGRADLPADMSDELAYLRPTNRAAHSTVWSDRWGTLLLYGGEALPREEAATLNYSYSTQAVGDLWAWGKKWCPSNCSLHGECWYGHCYCHDGYYGIDCSNQTCPGSYCAYDTDNHIQHCSHCCSAPWTHTDGEAYMAGVRKLPCDATHPGEINGVCSGFRECQCAPPFIGDDCSIKDCRNNCSSRGYCSVEYPVSRCICEFPYGGDDCSEVQCLNNCSYPNGVCDSTTGLCDCAGIASPYNRSVPWSRYGGDDCSWTPAFAGASGGAEPSAIAIALCALAGFAATCTAGGGSAALWAAGACDSCGGGGGACCGCGRRPQPGAAWLPGPSGPGSDAARAPAARAPSGLQERRAPPR